MIDLTKENFEEEVLKARGYVLVDFYGDGCVPCAALMPQKKLKIPMIKIVFMICMFLLILIYCIRNGWMNLRLRMILLRNCRLRHRLSLPNVWKRC